MAVAVGYILGGVESFTSEFLWTVKIDKKQKRFEVVGACVCVLRVQLPCHTVGFPSATEVLNYLSRHTQGGEWMMTACDETECFRICDGKGEHGNDNEGKWKYDDDYDDDDSDNNDNDSKSNES